MIEKILLDFLTSRLEVPVYCAAPHPKPARFVLIQRTGGGRRGLLKTATVAVQSWAESLYQAELLGANVLAAMDELVQWPQIAACRLDADYPFPYPEEKRHRVQAVYNITYYED